MRLVSMTVSLGKTGDTFVWPVVIKGTIGLAAGCCPFILIPVVGGLWGVALPLH